MAPVAVEAIKVMYVTDVLKYKQVLCGVMLPNPGPQDKSEGSVIFVLYIFLQSLHLCQVSSMAVQIAVHNFGHPEVSSSDTARLLIHQWFLMDPLP